MSVSGPHDLPIDHMPETRTHKRCRCLRMDHTSAAHTRAPGPPKRPGLQPEAHMSERPTHMSDGTPPATHMKTQKPTQANVLLPAPHTSERVPGCLGVYGLQVWPIFPIPDIYILHPP